MAPLAANPELNAAAGVAAAGAGAGGDDDGDVDDNDRDGIRGNNDGRRRNNMDGNDEVQ